MLTLSTSRIKIWQITVIYTIENVRELNLCSIRNLNSFTNYKDITIFDNVITNYYSRE